MPSTEVLLNFDLIFVWKIIEKFYIRVEYILILSMITLTYQYQL